MIFSVSRMDTPSRHTPGIWLLLVLVFAPVAALRAEHHMSVHFNGDLGLGYDSNPGNSQNEQDIRDSSFASGGLHAQYARHFTSFTSLQVRGSLLGEAHEGVEGLSNGRTVGMLRLVHRPAGGFFMPSFAIWGSAGWLEYNSRLRDGNEFRAGVSMTQPVNTAFTARLSVMASERNSTSEVFDLSGVSAGLNVDWRLLPALTLYSAYQFYQGDVASSTSQLLSGIGEPDDAYKTLAVSGKFSHISGGSLFAYRLDADSNIFTVGGNQSLSRNLSLDLQAQYLDVQADEGSRYERWITQAALLARF